MGGKSSSSISPSASSSTSSISCGMGDAKPAVMVCSGSTEKEDAGMTTCSSGKRLLEEDCTGVEHSGEK